MAIIRIVSVGQGPRYSPHPPLLPPACRWTGNLDSLDFDSSISLKQLHQLYAPMSRTWSGTSPLLQMTMRAPSFLWGQWLIKSLSCLLSAGENKDSGKTGIVMWYDYRWQLRGIFLPFVSRSTPSSTCWISSHKLTPFLSISSWVRWFHKPLRGLRRSWLCIPRLG